MASVTLSNTAPKKKIVLKVGNVKIRPKKKFTEGDFVWVKIKRYFFWPGRIEEPPATQNTLKKPQKKKTGKSRDCQHYVFFYGNCNYAWVEDEKIFPHCDELLDVIMKKKKSDLYSNAVEDLISDADTLNVSFRLMTKYKIQGPLTNFFLDGQDKEEVIKAFTSK
ncbi:oxidoreductase GLYR1-like protein [Trichonephila inaurata madagascariensis]|uniref:Oxidoreductase GLYR1-like protein n=1 Tax=Trichonephila inaurata madagascariensis TaxID=2747483 RepID=A0A8X6YDI5_9ARAC|nr:oxidoreductase GLYR1-like protein [Trichonephila inaurata madagascariensis]